MFKKKILLTGSTGLLGASLTPFLLEQENFKVIQHGFSREAEFNVDLCNSNSTELMLADIKPDVIINMSALTDVDKCETEPQQAYLVNVKIVENLCKWVRKNPTTHVVHISTDQVYDGLGNHQEADVILRNFYSYSKYCAELVLSTIPATILRTNFFGKSENKRDQSFSDWVLDSLRAGKAIKLFTDVSFSPISLVTMKKMMLKIIEQQHPGIFNLGSKNGMSKKDFIIALAEVFNLSTNNCEDALSTDFKLKALRPKNMQMDSSKFERTFGVNLPDLKQEIFSLRH